MSFLPPDTYTVSQLGEELQLILSETLTGVWIAGEVRRPTRSRAGHLYFELVEKGPGDSVLGSMQAVLFRRDFQRVQRSLSRAGIELQEGQAIRCFGGVDFYPAGGRLQFIARDVDPLFSLGDLAQRRQETLRELTRSGLRERNASLELPALPLQVALVTSAGSAADRDFVSTLEESAFAFEVCTFDVAVQGPAAEKEIVRALSLCVTGSSSQSALVVIIRGGGSRTDLAAFDSLAVAEAIARCPLPVLTGLGHETDESVADVVAHRAFKTPTAVAEFLCQEVSSAEVELERLARGLLRSGRSSLDHAAHVFSAVELRVLTVSRRLESTQARLEHIAERLSSLSRALIRASSRRLDDLCARLDHAAKPKLNRAWIQGEEAKARLLRASLRTLSSARQRLVQQRRWIEQLSPQRTLRRGFSVTRTVSGGIVRSASALNDGEVLITELGEGEVRSRVTETRTRRDSRGS